MRNLFPALILLLCSKICNAQNNSEFSFLRFDNEGKSYSFDTKADANMTGSGEVVVNNGKVTMASVIFINRSNLDTVIVYAANKDELVIGKGNLKSPGLSCIFFYKMRGRGMLSKVADNAKNGVNDLNYIEFSSMDSKEGGRLEGRFVFSDVQFKVDNQVRSVIKLINNGSFSASITKIGIAGNSGTIKQAGITPGAALMFKTAKCNLTDADKNMAFKTLGFVLSKDRKQLADKEMPDDPFDVTVTCSDLNKDGTEEIFIVYGNLATSGMTGSSIALLIKDRNGIYQKNLDFPAAEFTISKTMNKGFPDLSFAGAGFDVPVWRWNGKEYAFYKTMK